jgi:hypothetical protein
MWDSCRATLHARVQALWAPSSGYSQVSLPATNQHWVRASWFVVGEHLTVESLANAVAVRLWNPPEVLGALPARVALKAVEFVKANRDVLRRYWQGEMAAQ